MSRRRHYQNNADMSEYAKPSRQGRRNKQRNLRGQTAHVAYLDDFEHDQTYLNTQEALLLNPEYKESNQ